MTALGAPVAKVENAMLIAIVDDKWIDVSGEAAETLGAVEIVLADGAVSVEDNDVPGTIVPVSGDDPAGVMHLDASDITGAGVHIVSDYEGASKLIATGQDDLIVSASGDDTIKAYEGDDIAFGGEGNDFIDGHIGDDALSGGLGDDLLRGHSGDDLIDGGHGTDTVRFRGDLAEYTISVVDGRTVIAHQGGSGADGTDIVANVEWAEFADQTVALDSVPTNLVAVVDGKWLDLVGTAFDMGRQVTLVQQAATFDIADNDVISTLIPVVDDTSAVRHVDASGVIGAGVSITSAFDGTSNLIGTEHGDYMEALGGGDDKLKGYQGDDILIGGDGNDLIDGHMGDDVMFGGNGDDEFRGNRGDDIVYGGAGVDTFVFYGALSEYVLAADGDGFVISHVGGKASDGTDWFEDVEYLAFTDQTIHVEDWVFA